MSEDEKKYWVGMSCFPHFGPARFKLLLDYFGNAQNIWKANSKELSEIGLKDTLIMQFIRFREAFSFDKYFMEMEKKGIRGITLHDGEYPRLLKEIPNAPFLIYVRGDVDTLKGATLKGVAVVGTRRMTSYGREVTKRITEGLVGAGVTVVSGMAYGVDAVAHETAIECGGKTVAVLGCGIDMIHPQQNSTIYWKIVKSAGVAVSEYPLGRKAEMWMFPARNRIISGLTLGTVVIEGAEDSGALITARFAAEQGREVFAVPGPITSNMSKAPIKLLKAGAKLVTEARDILEELNIKNNPINTNNPILPMNEKMGKLSNEEKRIIEILQRENLHFDEMVRKTSIPAEKLGGILTVMEMKKLVKNLGGGIYGVFD